jgi:DNA-directed RNA polymerase specialized sigma24 family protein
VRVAINVSLNSHSGNRNVLHTDIDLAPIVASTEETPEAALTKAEATVRIDAASQLVRSDHRAAIVLRELKGGVTYREPAESPGDAEGTVKSWVHRGWEQLKRILIAA